MELKSRFSGMYTKMALALVVSFLGWAYLPPKSSLPITGSTITSPRIKLRDGRHLAYKETGVPIERAKYKIIVSHPYSCCKDFTIPSSRELVDELGVYFLSFDRPGYGESDPNPKRSVKSDAFDIEELADQLKLGSKFYVTGVSMGGCAVWASLKYLPHRLAGAALVVPVVNPWWPSFPSNLTRNAYGQRLPIFYQLTFWMVRYAPALFHWWLNQKWISSQDHAQRSLQMFSDRDKQILRTTADYWSNMEKKARQQGESESIYRDTVVGFGSWDFDPMALTNPFPNDEGSVHLWQGYQDALVPFELQRYVAKKLLWIKYHEVPDGGHLFMFADRWSDTILRALLLGEEPSPLHG